MFDLPCCECDVTHKYKSQIACLMLPKVAHKACTSCPHSVVLKINQSPGLREDCTDQRPNRFHVILVVRSFKNTIFSETQCDGPDNKRAFTTVQCLRDETWRIGNYVEECEWLRWPHPRSKGRAEGSSRGGIADSSTSGAGQGPTLCS